MAAALPWALLARLRPMPHLALAGLSGVRVLPGAAAGAKCRLAHRRLPQRRLLTLHLLPAPVPAVTRHRVQLLRRAIGACAPMAALGMQPVVLTAV